MAEKCPACNANARCIETRRREKSDEPWRRYQCTGGHRFSTGPAVTPGPKKDPMKKLFTQLGTPKTLAQATGSNTRSRVQVMNAVRQDSTEHARDEFDKRVGAAAAAIGVLWGPKRV